MPSSFYIISGRVPTVLVDEAGDEAALSSLEEARETAKHTFMCQGLGYVIVECDENGIVGCYEAD